MISKYELTVGLEVHAELKTRTKMFCDSKNDPDELRPNVNVCPICTAQPGTLPVINKEAVRHVIAVGYALDGSIANYTEFDRKNYFYPDIPKGYQISQYKFPIVSGGSLNGVSITRVHLEEDTGTLIHADADTRMNADVSGGENLRSHLRESASLVDFNRAGVPLMELVTEPVIRSAKEAGDFARELQLLLRTLGVADANMEKGEMRVEANISVAEVKNQKSEVKSTGQKLGTKVEVKNLNSFRAVERAIDYEFERQVKVLEAGEKVVQETRGWDDAKQRTFSQRAKEESHDYRYFPDPDLPKLMISEISEFGRDSILSSMPELPAAKRERYKRDYSIKDEDVEMYVRDPALAKFFEASADGLSKEACPTLSNYIVSDVIGAMNTSGLKLPNPDHMRELVSLLYGNEITSRAGKDILLEIMKDSRPPRVIAEERGLFQKNDEGELKKIAESIMAANPKVVEDYKKGKESSLQFLIGQAMKITKGSANPALLKEIFKRLLNSL